MVKMAAILAGLMVTVLPGGAALAQTTVDITVSTSVPLACAITVPGGTVELNDPAANGSGGTIFRAYSNSLPLPMSCNAPFRVTMRSSQGALINPTLFPYMRGAFLTSLPYTLGYSIPLDNGTTASISGCTSASIEGIDGCQVNAAWSAINKTMTATISWPQPSAPLYAGTFSDTITIKLQAVSW